MRQRRDSMPPSTLRTVSAVRSSGVTVIPNARRLSAQPTTIYRTMSRDDGVISRPAVGESDLGCRIGIDVRPDENDIVGHRANDGMSAFDDPWALPSYLKPPCL